MSLSITGTLFIVFDSKQVTDKFKLRNFIIEVDDNGYKQYIKFQLNQDKVSLMDNQKVGSVITVHFNLTGKLYTNKELEQDSFTNLVAWKIDGAMDENNSVAASQYKDEVTSPDSDVLPF